MKKMITKSLDEFIYQYHHAGLFVDRREALIFALKHQTETKALNLLKECLHDKLWRIRSTTLEELCADNDTVKNALEADIANIAKNETNKPVKARAITMLGNYKKPEYKQLFLTAYRSIHLTPFPEMH